MGLNNDWQANVLVSIGWVLIHVPITIFVLKLAAPAAISYLFLTFVFGLGSAFLYSKTKNIASSIFLHVLWEWPIILFR
jgi:membrane protease YdiL (CAAX protease family)